jgi:hypothetical protein
MFRIFRPMIVLLVGTFICASLIAAHPLPPQTAPVAVTPADATLTGMLPSPDVRPPQVAPARRTPARIALAMPRPRTANDLEGARWTGALAAPATHLAAPPAAPARLPGHGPRMPGTLVTQTERLDLYVGKQTFSAAQVEALAPLLEQLLRDNEARFGTTIEHRISIAFYRPAIAPRRGVRGMAYTDSGRAEVFYRPYEDIGRAATVATHELGHHLEAQRYGEAVQRRADTVLHEGLATWITGPRWLANCGASSWKERARQLRDAGVPLRLLTAERSGPDNAYEMWASFVDFLAERYGWEKLDALYRSGRGRAPGSSDYQAVLGKSLEEVAEEWRAWIGE